MALKDPTAKEFKKSSLNINEGEHEHGKHPNSLKNLQKWEKGKSPNPLGRPFKYSKIKQELIALGKEITNDYHDKPQGTRKEQVLRKLWDKAIRGDIQFVKILIFLGAFDE
tara:strand:+ start:117 stop:449 length:333 start_codon:yes stop_codon:yes gene_type:complete